MNCSSCVFSRCSCFWKRLTTKAMLRCSASTRKRSLAAMMPTMPLKSKIDCISESASQGRRKIVKRT